MVFAGGVDTSATETKGTVLIQSAEQVHASTYFNMMYFSLHIPINCESPSAIC